MLPQLRPYQHTCIEMIQSQEVLPKEGERLLNGVQIRFKGAENESPIYVRKFSRGRAIMEIDAGLGKSRIALESIWGILEEGQRILIMCKKNSINTWRREINKWLPEDCTFEVIHGMAPQKRHTAWQRSTAQIIITTYDTYKNDEKSVKHNFTAVICDECQKIRNFKLKLTKACIRGIKKCAFMLFLSAAIVRKGPQDLFTYMHCLNPRLHKGYWAWVNTFTYTIKTHFGNQIGGPRNTAALAQVLSTNMIRIKEKDVEDQRPPLNRDLLEYDMDEQQQRLYSQMTKDMLILDEETGAMIVSPNAAVKQLRLRQILVCPKVLDEGWGYGEALKTVVEKFEDDPHCVIFTPFAKAIPIFSDYITSLGFETPFVLKGGSTPNDIKYVEDVFNSSEGSERACLVSTKFAESFELWTAKQCFHIGFEWMQDTNYQAEKRLHRLITPHPVNSYYLAARNSMDKIILDKLDERSWDTQTTFKEFNEIANQHWKQNAHL